MTPLQQKAMNELLRPCHKRTLGNHGDFSGFKMLIDIIIDLDIDLYNVGIPKQMRCSTCKFMTVEFNDRMPCWECVEDDKFSKWRPRD